MPRVHGVIDGSRCAGVVAVHWRGGGGSKVSWCPVSARCFRSLPRRVSTSEGTSASGYLINQDAGLRPCMQSVIMLHAAFILEPSVHHAQRHTRMTRWSCAAQVAIHARQCMSARTHHCACAEQTKKWTGSRAVLVNIRISITVTHAVRLSKLERGVGGGTRRSCSVYGWHHCMLIMHFRMHALHCMHSHTAFEHSNVRSCGQCSHQHSSQTTCAADISRANGRPVATHRTYVRTFVCLSVCLCLVTGQEKTFSTTEKTCLKQCFRSVQKNMLCQGP
jgi:hypothetical protein